MTSTAPTGILPSSSGGGASATAAGVAGCAGVLLVGIEALLGERSGAAKPMIALKRCERVRGADWGGAAELVLAALLTAGLSRRRKRDMRPGWGSQSGPSESCIVDTERSLSDSSSSVAGEAGVSGEVGVRTPLLAIAPGNGVNPGRVAGRRDGPATGEPEGEAMGSSMSPVSSPSTRLRFGPGEFKLFCPELDRSRLLAFCASWSRRRKVDMRRRKVGRRTSSSVRRAGWLWEAPIEGGVGGTGARGKVRGCGRRAQRCLSKQGLVLRRRAGWLSERESDCPYGKWDKADERRSNDE